MDLLIEPVTVLSWPLYRAALKAQDLPAPLVRPRRGLMLTRLVRDVADGSAKKEAVAGGCVYRAGDLSVLLHAFGKQWSKEDSIAAVAPFLTRLGQALADIAYVDGATLVAFPWSENAFAALGAMGFKTQITGLAR
jgi:hypothetical protein